MSLSLLVYNNQRIIFDHIRITHYMTCRYPIKWILSPHCTFHFSHMLRQCLTHPVGPGCLQGFPEWHFGRVMLGIRGRISFYFF